MFLALQSNPILVRVVEEAPVESTTVADVLIGAIGLTGLLIIVALIAGGLLGGALVGIKKWREKSGREPIPDSEALKIT